MLPSAARAYLLAHHQILRTQLATCGEEARRLLAGEPRADAWLEPLLLGSETVGPRQVARMIEEHVAEHATFREMFEGTVHAIAARMDDIIEEIETHMAAEERTFLSVAVLRDEPAPAR